jgi:pyruvate,water dikinase
MFAKYIVSVLASISFLACSPQSSPSVKSRLASQEDLPIGKSKDAALFKVNSREEFESISNVQPGTSAIQFLYFYGMPKDDPLFGQIHFPNFFRFSTHWDYIYNNFERWKQSLENDYRLTADVQQEITGGSIFLRDAEGDRPERLAFNFAYEVNDRPEDVKLFYDKIKELITFVPAEQITYLARTSSEVLAVEKLGIKAERQDDFFATSKNYIFYSEATSYGYLRRISPADLKAGRYNEKDILILDEIPLDLGPISGVMSSVPQVPNSHVILRCLNQKVPDVYLKQIPSYLKDFENKLVRFSVSSETSWLIQGEADVPNIKAEAEAYWKERQKVIPTPEVDLSVDEIYVWRGKKSNPLLVKSYGAKASNFAILDEELRNQGVDRSLYDHSFMVPFSFAAQHLKGAVTDKACKKAAKKCEKDEGSACTEALALCEVSKNGGTLESYLAAMVDATNKKRMSEDPEFRRKALSFARRLIRAVDLPAPVLKAVKDGLAAYPENRRMRLRSSTNAEDLSGLNGAGLYESKAACLADPEGADDDDGKPSACRTAGEDVRIRAQVAKLRAYDDPTGDLSLAADDLEESLTNKYSLSDSIRAVYASVWTERAYLNREYYGLVHNKVYMGILAHPSFVDEYANGVAVVTFTAQGADLNIVAQIDDVSITNPLFPDAIPEQTVGKVDDKGKLLSFDVISRSNLKGDVIPSEAKRNDLARQLYLAAKALKGVLNRDRMDLEFMLDANQNVIIKQGRPL